MQHFNVLIIGGGYAGIMCALRMANRLRHTTKTIALINPHTRFIERIRLHENLGKTHTKPLRTFNLKMFLGARNITFIEAKATHIDRPNQCVNICTPDPTLRPIKYDRLVIAVGSHSRNDAIPGLNEHAYTLDFGTARGHGPLHAAVKNTKAPHIVVVGAGATGVEIAMELALRKDVKITLVDKGSFGTFVLPAIAKHIRNRLKRAGVVLLENTDILSIRKNTVILESAKIPFDLCISAIGFCVPDFLVKSGLPSGTSGRLFVDGALRCIEDKRIYVVGDAALPIKPCGAPARMSVFFALTTGAFVGHTIADDFAGKSLKPFGYWTYGQAIGLGKGAIGYNTLRYDKAVKPYFTDRAAYQLRRFFVWVLFGLLKMEHHLPGLPFYLGQPLRRTLRSDTNISPGKNICQDKKT